MKRSGNTSAPTRSIKASALAAAVCCLAACGSDFSPKSAVIGLRVLSVRVDTPYAKPGTQPNLDMLLVDGSGVRRTTTVAWLHGCTNPGGDLYEGCYPGLAQRLAQAYGGKPARIEGPAGDVVTVGTHTVADVPADAITSRPPPVGPGAIPQARVFVFFVACAGHVLYDPTAPATNGLPVRCVDDRGEDLGADDFVFGYAPIFVFDELTNANPIVSGVKVGGAPVERAACSTDGACEAGYGCSNGRCLPVVPRCTTSKEADCPRVALEPVIDPGSAEIDPIASGLDGTQTREALWVEYEATNGRFADDARVVNDPNTGWSDGYASSFESYGSAPGEAHLYAVVRDNRGGQTWVTADVLVR